MQVVSAQLINDDGLAYGPEMALKLHIDLNNNFDKKVALKLALREMAAGVLLESGTVVSSLDLLTLTCNLVSFKVFTLKHLMQQNVSRSHCATASHAMLVGPPS